MDIPKIKVMLPGTSVAVKIRDHHRESGFTLLQPAHELLFSVFLEMLKITYAQTIGNLAFTDPKEALQTDQTIEVRISMATFPFGCGQAMWAAGDFASMDIRLWVKGWSGCYPVFSDASFIPGHEDGPAISIMVDTKVAKRLLACQRPPVT